MLPIESLIFLDEFGSHLALTRTRARAPQGVRAEVIEPFERGSNISSIAALGLRGVFAPMTLEGAFDREGITGPTALHWLLGGIESRYCRMAARRIAQYSRPTCMWV